MYVRKVLIIEGLVNAVITISKLAIGLLTGSLVIIADAVHSFTDLVNNIFAYIAVKIAETPPDKSHPYGHQKFEQLAVFILASILTIVAFVVIVNAIKRLGQPVEQSMLGLVILTGTTYNKYMFDLMGELLGETFGLFNIACRRQSYFK
jgi:cation diffusion facilitator family transporter